MAKKYTRKQVTSLAALNKEQSRIRARAKRVRDEIFEEINPQQMVISFLGGLLSKKLKNKNTQLFSSGKKKKNSDKQTSSDTGNAVLGSIVGKVLKKAGISFLQWQLFNLALFIGKKVVHQIREKKLKQKMSHQ